MRDIKLSIIMPLFNVEDTIRLALDSILMQKVDFNYEIIAVDDCSTDNTLEILNEYTEKYPQIKIIKHEENQGNAIAFYNALCASNGDYFCVLDGDDYYTVKNKLQKQVDFLDGDKNEDYVAVTHKYLRVNSEGKIWKDRQLTLKEREHDYNDFLRQSFYYHTSTYMYRNIFRGNVPEIFKEPLMRGDNPRTFMHVSYTKGKVKFLDFVGSVYRYSENGIWSKTTPEAQRERNIKMFEFLRDLLPTKFEQSIYNKTIEYRKNTPTIEINESNWLSSDEVLITFQSLANQYTFKEKEFIFNALYKSEFIDSLCESIGFTNATKHNLIPSRALTSSKDVVLITISNLTTTGGGVYYEIKDIIKMYQNKNIYLLLTNIDCIEDLPEDVVSDLKIFTNLTLLFGQKENHGRLDSLIEKILSVKPEKIYHYCGHNNLHAECLIQTMFGKNICIFSFDHGFSLGLDNTSYDIYIVKRLTDYKILSKIYGDRVIYIPCWNEQKHITKQYIPFNDHNELITACGAARYYKLEGTRYIDLIIELLSRTKGKHFHYGPIEESVLEKIQNQLEENNIDKTQFIHIPWAKNIAQSMLENNIDIFIEPYSVVSYKLTLDILSAGIPTIVFNGKKRLQITDFIYDNALLWNNTQEFINTLIGLDSKTLAQHSQLAKEYYLTNHAIETIFPYFNNEKSFPRNKDIPFYDNQIINVRNIEATLNIKPIWPIIKVQPQPQPKPKKLTPIERIFSLTNTTDKKHKVLTIVGVKIKIKKRAKTCI